MGGVEVGRAAALRMIVIVEGEIAKKCNSRLLPSFHVSPSPTPFFLPCLRFRPSKKRERARSHFHARGGWRMDGRSKGRTNEGTLKVNGNEGGSKRAGKGLGGGRTRRMEIIGWSASQSSRKSKWMTRSTWPPGRLGEK